MATRIRQEYSGPADEVNIETDYPNYRLYAEVPINSEVNITVPPDVYRRLQQRLTFLQLAQRLKNE